MDIKTAAGHSCDDCDPAYRQAKQAQGRCNYHLPPEEKPFIDQVAAHCGFNAAATICALWGGLTLHIPKTPSHSHPIAQDLGADVAATLSVLFGGRSVQPPRLSHKALIQKHKAAMCRAHGLTDRQIAHVLDISIGRVDRLMKSSTDPYWLDWMDERDGASS